MDQTDPVDAIDLTAEIVSAFVSNNSVPVPGLADLIHAVHQGTLGLGQPSAVVPDEVAKATPAQIKKSITDDALISFEDGKGYKTLKRHPAGRGLTPKAYRAKHGLPVDYPMTAPGYSARRSAMAQSFGLGQKRMKAEPKAAELSESVAEAPKTRRGRPASGAAPKAPAKGRDGKKAATAVAAE
jgi:predicted transcriptional regulator